MIIRLNTKPAFIKMRDCSVDTPNRRNQQRATRTTQVTAIDFENKSQFITDTITFTHTLFFLLLIRCDHRFSTRMLTMTLICSLLRDRSFWQFLGVGKNFRLFIQSCRFLFLFFSPDLFMKISNFSKTVHAIFIKICTVILHPKGSKASKLYDWNVRNIAKN